MHTHTRTHTHTISYWPFANRVPEVGDFDVVCSVQQKILRLEIAVDHHKSEP